jgi:hypothetical protein
VDLLRLVVERLLLVGHEARLRDARDQLVQVPRLQDVRQHQRRALVLQAGDRLHLLVELCLSRFVLLDDVVLLGEDALRVLDRVRHRVELVLLLLQLLVQVVDLLVGAVDRVLRRTRRRVGRRRLCGQRHGHGRGRGKRQGT